MCAAVCLSGKNEPKYITLKLEPEEGNFLRGQYDDIIPGYYMNKQHWITILLDGSVSEAKTLDFLDMSYDMIDGNRGKEE